MYQGKLRYETLGELPLFFVIFGLHFFFNWRVVALQCCVGFCHAATWSATGIHMSPLSWTPFPFPALPHPSRLSQNTGFSFLCHRANSRLVSILHMVVCMFPYYPLSLCHPLLLPLCPQVCSLCLVSISALQIGSSAPSFSIPYTCVYMQYLSLFFWLTSLFRFIYLIRTDWNEVCFFFNSWLIFSCIYVPWLCYPFICWWTSRLLHVLAIVKSVTANIGVHVSLSVMSRAYVQWWDCWVIL